MGYSKDGIGVYPRGWQEVFQAAVNVLPTVKKMTLKNVDPASGRIIISSGISLASWGEEILVQVWEPAPGQAAVRVSSQVKAQLVDWGKNRKNVAAVFDALSRALGVEPQAPGEQTQG
jgi:hypothetical protein